MPNFVVPIPRLSFGKRQARSQIYHIATEDPAVVTKELPVISGCASMAEAERAYLVRPSSQYLDENGCWVQVVGERVANPKVSPGESNAEGEDINEAINKIHKVNRMLAQNRQFLKSGKNTTMDKLLWIVIIVCVTFMVIFGINHMKHGDAVSTAFIILRHFV